MTLLVAGALVSFSVGMTALGSANRLLTMMIGEINRKTPDDRQLSYFGFTPSRYHLIFREYRRLYPNGKLHAYHNVASIVAGLGLASTILFLTLLGRETTPRPSGY